MLTKSNFGHEINEKIVRGKNGKFFRVRFIVAQIDGEVCGRILSAEPIVELGIANYELGIKRGIRNQESGIKYEKKICLPAQRKENKETSQILFEKEIVSPYSTLEFFMSQMTRAPSYAKQTRK